MTMKITITNTSNWAGESVAINTEHPEHRKTEAGTYLDVDDWLVHSGESKDFNVNLDDAGITLTVYGSVEKDFHAPILTKTGVQVFPELRMVYGDADGNVYEESEVDVPGET